MKDAISVVIGLTLFIGLVYGMYWVGKAVSYSLFYEDMVTQTVIENVKANCLKAK